MITITIGQETKSYSEITEQWINQQINRRRDDDVPICIQVKIEESPLVNLLLTTPGCSAGLGGGGRVPNAQEQRIFELWNRHKLNTDHFTGGNLIAFLKQLKP